MWRRSISCWLGESSWNEYSTGMPIASSVWIVRLRSVAGDVGGGEVEVRAAVERHGAAVVVGSEVEELHLRGDVEREAPLAGPVEVAPQHLAGVALEGRAVEVEDVAEHPGLGRVRVGPREQLEGVGVGPGEHVALLHPGEAVDRRAVEGHALLEGVLELGGGDGEALQLAEHVGEPEPDEPDAALLDRAQHVVLLAFHDASLAARPCDGPARQFIRRSHAGNGGETASCHSDASADERLPSRRARHEEET